MVPFLDVANHAAPPNADFRLRGDAFELYALKDLDVDDEVCISYSGARRAAPLRNAEGTLRFVGTPRNRHECSSTPPVVPRRRRRLWLHQPAMAGDLRLRARGRQPGRPTDL